MSSPVPTIWPSLRAANGRYDVGVEQQQQLVDELLLEDVREGGAEGVDERQALVGCDLADLDHAVESTRTAYG